MQVRRLVISVAVAALVTAGLAWPRARPRPGASPAPKKVAAAKDGNYQLTETSGPWLIMAATFTGDGAEEPGAATGPRTAQETLKQNAYTYQKKFDFSKTIEGRGVDRLGGPQQMHYQRDDMVVEIAVLVGDYERVDDAARPENAQADQIPAARRLDESRENQPDDGRAFTPSKKRRSRATKNSPKKGRWAEPFMTTNPLLPRDYFVPKGLDKFVVDMNKGVKHSLLNCKGQYSVKVATFTGQNVLLTRKVIDQLDKGASSEKQIGRRRRKSPQTDRSPQGQRGRGVRISRSLLEHRDDRQLRVKSERRKRTARSSSIREFTPSCSSTAPIERSLPAKRPRSASPRPRRASPSTCSHCRSKFHGARSAPTTLARRLAAAQELPARAQSWRYWGLRCGQISGRRPRSFRSPARQPRNSAPWHTRFFHPTRRWSWGPQQEKTAGAVRALGSAWLRAENAHRFSQAITVEETGDTFAANAALKASEQAVHLGAWVLGEDSGLSVDALGGRPGVYSARYAGPGASDGENNNLLLKELAGVPTDRRTAHYTCHVALSDPAGQIVARSEAYCRGRIRTEPAGTAGFGYDPLVRDHRISPHLRRARFGRQTRAQPPRSGRRPTGGHADLSRYFASPISAGLPSMPPTASKSSRACRTGPRRERARSAPLAAPAPAPRRSCPARRSASLSPSTLPMKPFREWPDQQRAAQRVKLVAVGQQRQVVLVRFAEADARDPARSVAGRCRPPSGRRAARRDSRAPRPPRRRSADRLAWLPACRACASHTLRRRCSTARGIIAGSAVRAETSLMISAPASMAARATAALVVSIEIGTDSLPARSLSTTEHSRRSSSARLVGSA